MRAVGVSLEQQGGGTREMWGAHLGTIVLRALRVARREVFDEPLVSSLAFVGNA
jgi:hypothetical protein